MIQFSLSIQQRRWHATLDLSLPPVVDTVLDKLHGVLEVLTVTVHVRVGHPWRQVVVLAVETTVPLLSVHV